MRADRLLSILLLLQVNRRMTAGELAKRLEVSERTIHRDMEALSAAGVPVTAERGAGGGWALLERYRTDLTGLNDAEIQALFLSRPPRLLADLGLDRAEEGALIKLLAALPSGGRRDADLLRGRIHIDPGGWNRSEEAVPFLPVLQDAIWQERRLQMSYQRGDGKVVERLVDPLGLVAKGSAWYFVASVEGNIRTYRASRVTGAALTDEPIERPAGFDLAQFWEDSSVEFVAKLPRYPVLLRADPAIIWRMRYAGRFSRIESVSEPESDGWVTVHIHIETLEDAREFVLSFGAQVEVIEPAALRAEVIETLAAAAAVYSKVTSQ